MKTSIGQTIRKYAEAIEGKPTQGIDSTIEFETKSHYGGPELVYVTSKHKEPLQTLTNAKTLSSRHVQALKQLGFEFVKKS